MKHYYAVSRTSDDRFPIEFRSDCERTMFDPQTGKAFVVPPELQRLLPPGVNRPVQVSDYASHEAKLAQFYASVGATDLATLHEKQAADYQVLVHLVK